MEQLLRRQIMLVNRCPTTLLQYYQRDEQGIKFFEKTGPSLKISSIFDILIKSCYSIITRTVFMKWVFKVLNGTSSFFQPMDLMGGSLIHQLNTTTRIPFEISFVMLIGKIVFPSALGIQCLHENEKKLRSIVVVVYSWRNKSQRLFARWQLSDLQ